MGPGAEHRGPDAQHVRAAHAQTHGQVSWRCVSLYVSLFVNLYTNLPKNKRSNLNLAIFSCTTPCILLILIVENNSGD